MGRSAPFPPPLPLLAPGVASDERSRNFSRQAISRERFPAEQFLPPSGIARSKGTSRRAASRRARIIAPSFGQPCRAARGGPNDGGARPAENASEPVGSSLECSEDLFVNDASHFTHFRGSGGFPSIPPLRPSLSPSLLVVRSCGSRLVCPLRVRACGIGLVCVCFLAHCAGASAPYSSLCKRDVSSRMDLPRNQSFNFSLRWSFAF